LRYVAKSLSDVRIVVGVDDVDVLASALRDRQVVRSLGSLAPQPAVHRVDLISLS